MALYTMFTLSLVVSVLWILDLNLSPWLDDNCYCQALEVLMALTGLPSHFALSFSHSGSLHCTYPVYTLALTQNPGSAMLRKTLIERKVIEKL